VELSWPMKLRIAASAAIGVVLIGILAWPLAAPSEPFGTVSLLGGGLTTFDAVFLAILAFFSGFAAYFASWPHGREIGILAVQCGGVPELVERGGLERSNRWSHNVC